MRSYVGVHWRFDIHDYLKIDPKKVKEEKFKARALSNDVAKHIYRTHRDPTYFLNKTIAYLQRHNITEKRIFISSPKSVLALFTKVGRHYQGYELYTTGDTQVFLNQFRNVL